MSESPVNGPQTVEAWVTLGTVPPDKEEIDPRLEPESSAESHKIQTEPLPDFGSSPYPGLSAPGPYPPDGQHLNEGQYAGYYGPRPEVPPEPPQVPDYTQPLESSVPAEFLQTSVPSVPLEPLQPESMPQPPQAPATSETATVPPVVLQPQDPVTVESVPTLESAPVPPSTPQLLEPQSPALETQYQPPIWMPTPVPGVTPQSPAPETSESVIPEPLPVEITSPIPMSYPELLSHQPLQPPETVPAWPPGIMADLPQEEPKQVPLPAWPMLTEPIPPVGEHRTSVPHPPVQPKKKSQHKKKPQRKVSPGLVILFIVAILVAVAAGILVGIRGVPWMLTSGTPGSSGTGSSVSGSTNPGGTSTVESPLNQPPPESRPPTGTLVPIGMPVSMKVESGLVTFTVLDQAEVLTEIGSTTPSPGMVFVAVPIEMSFSGSQTYVHVVSDSILAAGDGVAYRPNPNGTMAISAPDGTKNTFWVLTIQPGNSVQGIFVYQVPVEAPQGSHFRVGSMSNSVISFDIGL